MLDNQVGWPLATSWDLKARVDRLGAAMSLYLILKKGSPASFRDLKANKAMRDPKDQKEVMDQGARQDL